MATIIVLNETDTGAVSRAVINANFAALNSGATSGTVTSVNATVPAFLAVAGVPITSSGTIAITLSGTALPVANGGTGGTTAATGINGLLPSQATFAGKFLQTDGTNVSWQAASGFSLVVINATTNQTPAITSGELVIYMDATGGARTVTMPAVAGNTGVYVITKVDASVNTVTAVGTVNGVANSVLQFKNSSISLVSDGVSSYHIQ